MILPRLPTPAPIPQQLPAVPAPHATLLVQSPLNNGFMGLGLSERGPRENGQDSNALNEQASKKVSISLKASIIAGPSSGGASELYAG
jgi:hypothetical protein